MTKTGRDRDNRSSYLHKGINTAPAKGPSELHGADFPVACLQLVKDALQWVWVWGEVGLQGKSERRSEASGDAKGPP